MAKRFFRTSGANGEVSSWLWRSMAHLSFSQPFSDAAEKKPLTASGLQCRPHAEGTKELVLAIYHVHVVLDGSWRVATILQTNTGH